MTALARISNRSALPSFYNWIEDWFGRDYTLMDGFNTGVNMPAVNIRETDDSFVVEVAAPGMKKSDFDINLDNNLLTISSEHKVEDESSDNGNYTRREFSYTSFRRTFTLPDSVDAEAIKARYNDGILHLTLPKKEEAKLKPARTIEIK